MRSRQATHPQTPRRTAKPSRGPRLCAIRTVVGAEGQAGHPSRHAVPKTRTRTAPQLASHDRGTRLDRVDSLHIHFTERGVGYGSTCWWNLFTPFSMVMTTALFVGWRSSL